jgi:urease accessory protein
MTGSLGVAALLLGDSRFPAGGHAHSGGAEPAVTARTVTGLDSLEVFLRGRLRTTGLLASAVAAAACAHAHQAAAWRGADGKLAASGPDDYWGRLDTETDARTPSPAQRGASRRQGRALLRAARIAWPDALWLAELAAPAAGRGGAGGAGSGGAARDEYRGGPHHAVVHGAAAATAGCTPGDAARIAAYQAVAGPASAVVRLLALDPMEATGVLARLAGEIEQVAVNGAGCAGRPLDDLPCPSAPALDLLAETHIGAEVRLFES